MLFIAIYEIEIISEVQLEVRERLSYELWIG